MDARVVSKARPQSRHVTGVPARAQHCSQVHAAGLSAAGIAQPPARLDDHPSLDCLAATGRTLAENTEHVAWNESQDVLRPAGRPITKTGGVVGLKGNLAPEAWKVRGTGCQSGAMWKFAPAAGPARYGAVAHPDAARETHRHADI